ncbi:hypothetical protein E2C01_051643 [Portunus trituberculatus]|uniref:Uncharacterized protein n=1 Tax=Portunus trituberculatus TaxID=210409 RepID=A0A5B7GKW3_PORTR|nr:hypothetical protein [Portunus trituberculatus]
MSVPHEATTVSTLALPLHDGDSEEGGFLYYEAWMFGGHVMVVVWLLVRGSDLRHVVGFGSILWLIINT